MSLLGRLAERSEALFLLVAVLCAAGVWTATRLPSAIFPTVTFPRVKVIAEGAEEPAAQMIPAVTRPLEEAILRVPGIERVLSTTARGSLEIGAEFTWGTSRSTSSSVRESARRPVRERPSSSPFSPRPYGRGSTIRSAAVPGRIGGRGFGCSAVGSGRGP